MKRYFLLILLVLVVGCSARSSDTEMDTTQADTTFMESQLLEKDNTIAEMEHQIQELTVSYSSLRNDYDALQASMTEQESDAEEATDQAATYLCDDQLESMKYDSIKSAFAILDGWFAVRPEVQELQGTYTVQFWDDINTRVRTIRYISAEDGLSTTESFLVFFDEAGWQEGVLWLSRQCWLDSPHSDN